MTRYAIRTMTRIRNKNNHYVIANSILFLNLILFINYLIPVSNASNSGSDHHKYQKMESLGYNESELRSKADALTKVLSARLLDHPMQDSNNIKSDFNDGSDQFIDSGNLQRSENPFSFQKDIGLYNVGPVQMPQGGSGPYPYMVNGCRQTCTTCSCGCGCPGPLPPITLPQLPAPLPLLPPLPPPCFCPPKICPPPICPPPPLPSCPPLPLPLPCPKPLPCPIPLPPPPPLPCQCPPPLLPLLPQPQPLLPPPTRCPSPYYYTQNDCCCNCQRPCRTVRMRRYSLKAVHGAKTENFEEQKDRFVNTKCNSFKLQRIIQENIVNDMEESKRRIQMVAEGLINRPFNTICGKSEFSYIVHAKLYCQASANNISCYVFSHL